MNDWNPRANEIFLAALDCDSTERRQAYVAEACGTDEALRAQVESLLEADAEAAGFLGRPIAGDRPTEILSALTDPEYSLRMTDTPPKQTSLDFLQPSLQPGSLGRLGQYEISEEVGRGGMGVVLKANDTKLNRVVALKLLAPELAANSMARKRFLREAQAAAAVSHDHVVTIYAVEENDPPKESSNAGRKGSPFLVMEFIDGPTLQEKIDRQGHLELKEILRIGRQIAAGLAVAHQQGLVHRDVKPGNILLQNGVERVQITDFGLARATDDVETTRPGEVAGTPQYMSPEQAQGGPVDARSDLFSLGSVLYAMCTGRSPFRAETTVAVLRRVCEEQPRPIRDINPDIPVWLVEIIDRLLAKDREDRFSSAAEVSELLSKCLASVQQDGPMSMPGMVLPLKKQSAGRSIFRPRRWAVAALILIALGLTIGATEATGVTHLSNTVIRIMNGEGTLVVATDDPTVEVSIDGEELSITGAGLQEIKLRPGQYQFTATKDGRPIEQKLVSISRGGREVVSISREAPHVAGVESSVQPDAFVVLNSQGLQLRKFDSLEEAVFGSNAGDTIEIHGNGPFVTGRIDVQHPLIVRAATGSRPVISCGSPSLAGVDAWITTEANLVLEGLELQDLHTEGVVKNLCLIKSLNDSSLSVVNCRFVQMRPEGICFRPRGPRMTTKNSEFIKGEGPAFWDLHTRAQTKYVIDNCTSTGGAFLSVRFPQDGALSVSLTNSTVVGWAPPFVVFGVETAPQQQRLAFSGKSNVLNVRNRVMQVDPRDESGRVFTEHESRELIRAAVSWNDDGNLFGDGCRFLATVQTSRNTAPTPAIRSLDDWRDFWGSSLDAVQSGLVRLTGGDLRWKSVSVPVQLTPEDFRLRPDSAGYQAGPNGKDLGADIEFVGPGEAYERWKKTDDYQQWLVETSELMRGTAAEQVSAP